MAKRMTDANKWRKPFFDNLSSKMKLVWLYLCDACDHAGVWDINLRVMCFELKENVTIEEMTESFGDKIVWISDEKIFIPSFVEFQYGALNPQNRVHNSVINRLTKLNLWAINKGHLSPLQRAKDKDKDIDKEKDKDRKSSDDFLGAYLLGFEAFPSMRLVSEQTKLLWLDLYGDPDFIFRTIASGLPRYQNLMPQKQNPEVFFTDQLKFDWPFYQKHQKQNKSPGGMVKDL